MASFSTTRRDVQQEITDTIIRQIENGASGADWKMPWHYKPGEGFNGSLPVNVDGREYNGLNVILLWAAAMEKGYSRPIWGTFDAWKKLGVFPRKGEKASLCFYWSRRCNLCGQSVPFTVRNHDSEHRGEDVSYRIFCVGWSLFNIDQLTEIPAKFADATPAVTESEDKRIERAEKYFAALNATVTHGGSKAFYSSAYDRINLPYFDSFFTPEDYYSTRGHESVHWTGHKSRNDRKLGNRFGSEAYAMEELIAELGAAFLCAQLGISNEPRPDHAQYIAGWLKKLREDKTAIFTAAKHSRQALEFLNKTAGATGEDEATDELPIAA